MSEKTEASLLRFAERLREDDRSANTVAKYSRDAGRFARFIEGRELGRELVLEYRHSLLGRYSATSANSMIASVNAYLAFIGRTDLRIKQFVVQKKVFCGEDRELTRAEYTRLVRASDRKLGLILQTICGTGIRVSELKYVTFEAVKAGYAEVTCKRKTRTVFIVRDLRKKLIDYCRARGIRTGSVFVTRTGRPVCRTEIWRAMKAVCGRANVSPKKVFPHNLRHLFARIFYSLEKDIAKLADVLGHSSIETTRIYIISSGKEHRKRMELMKLII